MNSPDHRAATNSSFLVLFCKGMVDSKAVYFIYSKNLPPGLCNHRLECLLMFFKVKMSFQLIDYEDKRKQQSKCQQTLKICIQRHLELLVLYAFSMGYQLLYLNFCSEEAQCHFRSESHQDPPCGQPFAFLSCGVWPNRWRAYIGRLQLDLPSWCPWPLHCWSCYFALWYFFGTLQFPVVLHCPFPDVHPTSCYRVPCFALSPPHTHILSLCLISLKPKTD